MPAPNTFVTIPVPVSTGLGPSVDVTSLSFEQTLVVEGPTADSGELVLELSEDGTNWSPFRKAPIVFNPVPQYLKFVANKARVRRLSGNGAATATLGALSTLKNLYGTLGYTAIDTSAMGPARTIICSGTYNGNVIVEASNDGTQYDAIAQFNTGNSFVIFVYGSWSKMRLRSDSVLPSGSVSIGSGFPGQESTVNKFTICLNFAGSEELQNDGAEKVMAEARVNFGLFSQATMKWDIGLAGYCDRTDTLVSLASCALYINSTNSWSIVGGTQLVSIPLPDTTPTSQDAQSTVAVPAGHGYVQLTITGGEQEHSDFNGIVRSVCIVFQEV